MNRFLPNKEFIFLIEGRVQNENFKGDLNREKRAGPECL